jgi:hypothetical protein
VARRSRSIALALTALLGFAALAFRAGEGAVDRRQANVIRNGSFERSLGGWQGFNARVARVSHGKVGRRAARVTVRGDATDYSLYPDPRPVAMTTAGTAYTAYAWVRSARTRKRVCLRIREWSVEAEAGAAQACLLSTRSWRRFPLVRYSVTGSGHSLDVYVYQPAAARGDNFEVDGIVLLKRNTPPPPGASAPVLIAAGDIASCLSSGDEATAALLDRLPGTVATLGDNAYENGTGADFAECYQPTWGRHKARTRPSAGNHDFHTPGAAGYFDYFGAAAGPRPKGYYSYDIGPWHLVVLNSNCDAVGGCGPGSLQGKWLRADLEAHRVRCTLAYWHHPRFSSGEHGDDTMVQPFWEVLYAHGADVVLSGHDHDYERFAPQTPGGAVDQQRGIREFVVGTGGGSRRVFRTIRRNSEVRDTKTFGVLRLDLRAGEYTWLFVPEAGKTFTDSGTGRCH